MWTQRDQIQAYQFLRRRLVSALVVADANSPTSPNRRLILTTTIGVGAALLISAVFGIIGLLNPGNSDWRSGGQVLVESDSGARFVLGADGLLHPVLNYASARLLAGGKGDKTTTISGDTLAEAGRGATLGIPGAPDSLPTTEHLLGGPWTRCSSLAGDRPQDAAPVSLFSVGVSPSGRDLRDGDAVLVKDSSDTRYLVAGGHRFRVAGPAAAAALGLNGTTAVPASTAWLNTLPAGRDLAVLPVPDAGRPGPTFGTITTRVGQVLTAGTTGTSYYVVTTGGIAAINEVEAGLILAAPENGRAYSDQQPAAIAVGVAQISAAKQVPLALGSASRPGVDAGANFPSRIPAPVAVPQSDSWLCAFSGPGTDGVTVRVGTRGPIPAGKSAAPGGPALDDRVADAVYVPPGAGMVVREQPAPGTAAGAIYLVTDTGRKYPVGDADSLAALGYGGVAPVGVPASITAMLPTGPALSQFAAQAVAPGAN